MATACELMCQPSASSAIELNHQPATISTTIVAAVIHMTRRVPRSAAWLPRVEDVVVRPRREIVGVHGLVAVRRRWRVTGRAAADAAAWADELAVMVARPAGNESPGQCRRFPAGIASA